MRGRKTSNKEVQIRRLSHSSSMVYVSLRLFETGNELKIHSDLSEEILREELQGDSHHPATSSPHAQLEIGGIPIKRAFLFYQTNRDCDHMNLNREPRLISVAVSMKQQKITFVNGDL